MPLRGKALLLKIMEVTDPKACTLLLLSKLGDKKVTATFINVLRLRRNSRNLGGSYATSSNTLTRWPDSSSLPCTLPRFSLVPSLHQPKVPPTCLEVIKEGLALFGAQPFPVKEIIAALGPVLNGTNGKCPISFYRSGWEDNCFGSNKCRISYSYLRAESNSCWS